MSIVLSKLAVVPFVFFSLNAFSLIGKPIRLVHPYATSPFCVIAIVFCYIVLFSLCYVCVPHSILLEFFSLEIDAFLFYIDDFLIV